MSPTTPLASTQNLHVLQEMKAWFLDVPCSSFQFVSRLSFPADLRSFLHGFLTLSRDMSGSPFEWSGQCGEERPVPASEGTESQSSLEGSELDVEVFLQKGIATRTEQARYERGSWPYY